MTDTPLRALTFTTLYPSAARPRHGIFVQTRLVQIRRHTGMQFEVVAPVPWFPFSSPRFGRYADFARTPRSEIREEVRVRHPRYPMLPRVGMYLQPFSLAVAAASSVRAAIRDGFDFDLIDAHYLYPDAVAASILAREFDKPFVVTARGSDVNVLMGFAVPRALMLRALVRAGGIATVSSELRDKLAEGGVDRARMRVLRNGVDTELFRPFPRPESRRVLGLADGPVVAAVGNLVPEKGYALAIDAIASVRNATLLIVGDGPERPILEARARARGVGERVRFLAVRRQRELPVLYSAADALVVSSTREGWPNVALEAIACGTPVVSVPVGGVAEMIGAGEGGIMVRERTSEAVAGALRKILADPPDRDGLVRHAGRFGWEETAQGFASMCRDVVGTARPGEYREALQSTSDTGSRNPHRKHA